MSLLNTCTQQSDIHRPTFLNKSKTKFYNAYCTISILTRILPQEQYYIGQTFLQI